MVDTLWNRQPTHDCEQKVPLLLIMHNHNRKIVRIYSDRDTIESITEPKSKISYVGSMQDLNDYSEHLYQVTVTNGKLRNSLIILCASSNDSIADPGFEDAISVTNGNRMEPTNTNKLNPVWQASPVPDSGKGDTGNAVFKSTNGKVCKYGYLLAIDVLIWYVENVRIRLQSKFVFKVAPCQTWSSTSTFNQKGGKGESDAVMERMMRIGRKNSWK